MINRLELEEREYALLAPEAAKARETRGRREPENEDDMRTAYQRDRDRIIHSKALRRLMHKTQVFLSPEGDHFRTRLTHTLDVAQISRTISRSLALNEDLTEAIAMGHDLGHTPFGHNGEEFLNERHEGGFKHNEQSLRVVDYLETKPGRQSMNLTYEVRDGILNHTGKNLPCTLEGQVVRISDRIAYINHDIDDALRAGVITVDQIPSECLKYFGWTHRERINTMIRNLISSSENTGSISMSEDCLQLMDRLRSFMFNHVYHSPIVKKDAELEKVRNLIFMLYDYYENNPDKLPEETKNMIDRFGIKEVVKDHIAGMTDRYAINTYKDLFVPTGWKSRQDR